MANNLLTPVLEGGIRSTNFFNGRLLSGEDLSQEQSANRDARRQLGKALGDGVAYGLEVTKSSDSTPVQPIISVSPGLAVNRRGQTLPLPAKTDISLVRSMDSTDSTGKTFVDCRPVNPDIYVAGPGAYVVLMCPAKGSEGRAPMSGLGNIPASCNTKYLIDGVQFRLLKLDISDQDLSDTNRLRNRLAYKCFGVTDSSFTDCISDLFGDHDPKYGLLDGLRPKILTDCDVPLALLYWTSTDGIVFVDTWAVRRGITSFSSAEGWLQLASPRRISEGQAIVLQFQDQIEDILSSTTDLATIEGRTIFEFLPPVGLLPIASARSPKGFDYLKFFKDLTCRDPIFVEGAKLGELVRTARAFAPIDLASKEMIWLYRVRENTQSVQNATTKPPQLCMIFTRGHIAFQGNAQYDLSKWDYSNYAITPG